MAAKRSTPETPGLRSQKLRGIMETRAGLWLSFGITATRILFAILFLLLRLIPIDRFNGASVISYLLQ